MLIVIAAINGFWRLVLYALKEANDNRGIPSLHRSLMTARCTADLSGLLVVMCLRHNERIQGFRKEKHQICTTVHGCAQPFISQ